MSSLSRAATFALPANSVRTGREPILLANAGYYGTLAAARSLGRAGVEIITADPSFLCPARYSCHVRRHLKCPDFEQVSDWAEWLLRLGRSERHSVVYATSDAVSFALALYRDELSRNFALYQPHIDTIISILDKGRLLQRAAEAGFDTPATWLPKSPEEAGQIARSVGGKFLVKPRSQLAQRTFTKGYVARAHEVPATFNQYIANANRDSEFGKAYPESLTPLLQQYYPEALSGIYSLSGFRDRGGRLVVKAARKVLQRPRQVGVGVCFEGAPLDPGLVDCTARLCEHIGYYGVFELEFVTVGSKSMLIDFNGRFYNQIRLDVARGMDLPRMAYAAAMGLQDEVSDLMSDVAAHAHCDQFAFCNGLELSLIVGLQRVCRTMSAQEAQQWRSWSNDVSRTIVDSVRDGTDPMPHFIDMAQHLAMAVRHPRSFIKQYGQLQ